MENQISELPIVGIVVSELSKSDRLSVNTVNDEIWFTDRRSGKTLKTKIIG